MTGTWFVSWNWRNLCDHWPQRTFFLVSFGNIRIIVISAWIAELFQCGLCSIRWTDFQMNKSRFFYRSCINLCNSLRISGSKSMKGANVHRYRPAGRSFFEKFLSAVAAIPVRNVCWLFVLVCQQPGLFWKRDLARDILILHKKLFPPACLLKAHSH